MEYASFPVKLISYNLWYRTAVCLLLVKFLHIALDSYLIQRESSLSTICVYADHLHITCGRVKLLARVALLFRSLLFPGEKLLRRFCGFCGQVV